MPIFTCFSAIFSDFQGSKGGYVGSKVIPCKVLEVISNPCEANRVTLGDTNPAQHKQMHFITSKYYLTNPCKSKYYLKRNPGKANTQIQM